MIKTRKSIRLFLVNIIIIYTYNTAPDLTSKASSVENHNKTTALEKSDRNYLGLKLVYDTDLALILCNVSLVASVVDTAYIVQAAIIIYLLFHLKQALCLLIRCLFCFMLHV